MKRVAAAISAVGVLGALAGCGGSAAPAPPRTIVASRPPAPTATAAAPGGLPACASRVRTTAGAPVVKPGLCTADGITLSLAAAGQTVGLRTLAARATGARLSRSVSSPVAARTAAGTFLVVTLAVTNRASSPAAFDGLGATQTALQASGANFREAVEAETAADLGSCLAKSMTPIQPGATVTCDVIFDVPPAVARHLRIKGGGLLVLNFGDSIDTVTRSVTEPGLLTLSPVH
jgi:hypothetical protein